MYVGIVYHFIQRRLQEITVSILAYAVICGSRLVIQYEYINNISTFYLIDIVCISLLFFLYMFFVLELFYYCHTSQSLNI